MSTEANLAIQCPGKYQKMNKTKALLSLHLKAIRHHACIDEEEWLLTEVPMQDRDSCVFNQTQA